MKLIVHDYCRAHNKIVATRAFFNYRQWVSVRIYSLTVEFCRSAFINRARVNRINSSQRSIALDLNWAPAQLRELGLPQQACSMATKNCPKCSSQVSDCHQFLYQILIVRVRSEHSYWERGFAVFVQVPVVCKKCVCGHTFFSPRKGSGASGSGQSGFSGASSSIQEVRVPPFYRCSVLATTKTSDLL